MKTRVCSKMLCNSLFQVNKLYTNYGIYVVITWSRLAGMKFQPVQRREISPYDYMRKLNFVPARQDSPLLGICMHFLWNFFWKRVIFRNWEPLAFRWFKNFLFFFIKKKQSLSQVFFKIGVLKNFIIFTEKHEC